MWGGTGVQKPKGETKERWKRNKEKNIERNSTKYLLSFWIAEKRRVNEPHVSFPFFACSHEKKKRIYLYFGSFRPWR